MSSYRQRRIMKFENPIGSLDPSVRAVSELIYQKLKEKDQMSLEFDDSFYEENEEALRTLSRDGHIKKEDVQNLQYPLCVYLTNHLYILYLADNFEENSKMENIIHSVDNGFTGKTLNAETLSKEEDLPKCVIQAVFELYESNGHGCCTGGCKNMRYQVA